ncbi:MAG: UDP-N-acetylmuramate--L-alanine ligase [Bacillota bacterium]
MGLERRTTHFIGIGGAGMSGLAKILLEMGYPVSGSDLRSSNTINKLEQMGAMINIGHRTENITSGVGLVVVSSAIPIVNPELAEARDRGLDIIHRGEMLARLMQEREGIAVAGAHGKTTTTSMISVALIQGGLDPTIIVGGEISEIGGNARLGAGQHLVAEADESDGSFLRLSPKMAVVTNIEEDHLDYYGNLEKILEAFKEFIGKVPENGLVILGTDSPWVRKVSGCARSKTVSYGLREDADYTARNISFSGITSVSEIYFRDEKLGMLELTVPGKHNIINALGAIATGHQLGLSLPQMADALRQFRGVQRRFQAIGLVSGIQVVDDYAHHPTEVKETLNAARQAVTGRLVVVFQPHRYSRTKHFYEEFGASFAEADELIIMSIYPAGEKPIPGVDAQMVVDAANNHRGRRSHYLNTKEEVVEFLSHHCQPGDLVLTMGAGDVWKVGVELVEQLQANKVACKK